jgi:manganese-dependent inorganic pyrophosphatase
VSNRPDRRGARRGACRFAEIDSALLEMARQRRMSILVSPHDMATTAMMCRAAVTIAPMIHEHFHSFHGDERLDDAQAVASASHYQAFPVLDAQKKVVGIPSKSDFLKKVRRQLILVDHNELSQAVPGADQVETLPVPF